MSAAQCVFCNGAPSNERLAESERFLAIADGYPVSPGHALIVSREHVESLRDLEPDEMAEAFVLLVEVCKLIDAERDPDGYDFGVNDGRAAGRTVDHLHIHVIPRYWGDVPDPRGGVRNIIPSGPSPDLWSSATPASAGEPKATPKDLPEWREDELGAYDARTAKALTDPVTEEPTDD